MKNIVFIFISFLFITDSVQCQRDPLRSNQTGTALTLTHPSFIGWHGGLQLNGNLQPNLNGFGKKIGTYHLGADWYIPKLKSALGVNLSKEIIGSLKIYRFAFTLAHRFEINQLYLLPTIGFGNSGYKYNTVCQKSIAYNSCQKFFEVHKSIQPQLSTGLGAVYQDWFASLNYQHSFDASNYSTLYSNNGTSRKTRTKTKHFEHGFTLLVGRSLYWKSWLFQPTLAVITNLTYSRIDLNLNAIRGKFYAGFRYGYNDHIALGLGYNIKGAYRISYSHVRATSRIGMGANGIHEIGLRVLLFQRPEHRIMSDVGIF